MIHEWNDLSGIREQILANVSIAFPLISPRGVTPSTRVNGNAYNIIVCRMNGSSYQAVVVYGPSNRVFAVGEAGKTDKMALLTLLEGTHALIGELYDSKKLPLLRNENSKSIIENFVYEPGAGC